MPRPPKPVETLGAPEHAGRAGARSPATAVLERSLADFRGDLTLADAATRGGLALRDAERGMLDLVATYQGHIAATDKGELVFKFPRGLVSRPETSKLRKALAKVGRAVRGVGRFVVRAWVSVVMVGYALIFALVLLALVLRSDDNRDDGPSAVLNVILRAVAEALYWTFHPFSPVFIAEEPGWVRRRRQRGPRLPFYERVNRFVFGPPPAPEPDEAAHRRAVMAEIRAQKGRISLGDVLRVTALPPGPAEALIARMLVDAEGEIEVSDEGALYYRFPRLRQTAELGSSQEAVAAAVPRLALAPLTGNAPGTNALLMAVNGFNLLASSYVIAHGLTLERLAQVVTVMTSHVPGTPPVILPPPEGVPLFLGWVPLVFSAALFALPVGRALRRPSRRKRVERENGRRALIPLTLGPNAPTDLAPRLLSEAWTRGAGRAPTDDELRDAARSLGGELELGADGQLVYRFAERAREREALLAARQAAPAEEARAGAVVFASDAPLDDEP